MEPTIASLNEKIDALTAQVAYLTEQARRAERSRQEREELIRDLTPVANEAFRLTVQQLEEVQEYIDLRDLLRLFKRLLRNGRNLEKMLDQLESTLDLIETMLPISDEMFGKVANTLEGLEHKGYFALAQSGVQIADKVVTTLTQPTQPLDTSLLALARQMNDPSVRRGLALMLRVLSVVGAQVDERGSIVAPARIEKAN
ncbi:MAG: DUF1641 domain-containing protein [Anaerolineae bacterium]|nr:DUF1641 domain-containing protein [Anaerolineae bacterium]